MATFQVQVTGLTNITISSSSTNPIESELSTFLTDGAKEIINILPSKLKEKCMVETTLSNSPETIDLDTLGGEILYVTRLSADSGGKRLPCRQIPLSHADLASDSTSLHYASVTDPVYWISSSNDSTILSVLPTPTANQTTIVYNVGYPSVAYSESVIANFPNEAEYLVVLYAAIKSLQNAMSGMGGISDLSISSSAPTIPSDPTISGGSVAAISIDALPSAPDYTAPVVASDSSPIELTTIVSLDAENTIDDFDGNAIEFDQWFSTVTHLIEDEEDIELASASLKKIQTYIQAYSQAMQNQLNIFNEGNTVYQAAIQRNLEQARINMQDAQKEADLTLQAAIQDYTLELQLYVQELGLYQQNINKEVIQYKTNLEQYALEYQWYQTQQIKLQQDYDKGIGMLITPGVPKPVKQERAK